MRIQMHRSELLRSIGMRQEERAPRRTASHPNAVRKDGERVPPEARRTREEWSGERLAYLQRETGALAPEPPRGREGQEKEMSRSAKRRRKERKGKTAETGRTVPAVQAPETRRETRTVEVAETERTVPVVRTSETRRATRTVEAPETERTVQTVRTSETRREAQTVEVPETGRTVQAVRTSETHREMPAVHILETERTVQTAETPKTGQAFETIQILKFRQELRMAGEPGPRLDALPPQIWQRVLKRAFTPFNWPLIQNLSGARRIPAGETRAVLWSSPVLPEELSGEGAAFGREIRIHSHRITALGWRSMGLAGEETALDSLSLEVRLLPQVTAAGQLLGRDSVIQTSGEGVLRVWRQMLQRNGLEIHRRVLERLPGVLSRREDLRSVTEKVRQRGSRRIPERTLRTASVFREGLAKLWSISGSILADTQFILTPSASETAWHVPVRSVLELSRPAAARDSRTFWRQILRRAYTAVSRKIFRDVSTVRAVPAGGGGAIRFIPALRKERLPGGAITFLRETQIGSNGISFLNREGPVREFTAKGHTPEAYPAEGYTFEEYTAPDGLPPEVRLLPQPAASEQTIYRVSGLPIPGSFGETVWTVHWQGPARGGLTLYRQMVKRSLQEVRNQLMERMSSEAYQQVIERSTPEVYRQIIKRSAPEAFERMVRETPPKLVGRKVFRNVLEDYRRTVLPNVLKIFRPVFLESGPSVSETWTSGRMQPVERRTVLVQRDTDTFVQETWTRNYILYRLFQRKHGTEPGMTKAVLFLEGERGKEAAVRRDGGAHAPGQTPRQGLTHFAQPLEMTEGTLSPLPVYQAPEGERPQGMRPVSERNGHSSRHPEAEKAQGERDGEIYVQSVLTSERTEGNPVIVYRSPARPGSPAGEPASAPALPGQVEGEDVFRAQTVTPGQARALGQAFSYEAPERRREEHGQLPADGVPPLRAEESMNYNRLTEEILVRLERRLRAERRKFGL